MYKKWADINKTKFSSDSYDYLEILPRAKMKHLYNLYAYASRKVLYCNFYFTFQNCFLHTVTYPLLI